MPLIDLKNQLDAIELRVGNFSTYTTTTGPAQNIPLHLKPAQQLLVGLGANPDQKGPLSYTLDQQPLPRNGNKSVTIAAYSEQPDSSLTISGQRIDRLLNSPKLFVNTDLIPSGFYAKAIAAQTIKPQDVGVASLDIHGATYHWQNAAVAVCHSQEVDLLIDQQITADNKALTTIRTGQINDSSMPLLMLSSPALNFTYGLAKELTKEQQHTFIIGMYRNLFNAAVSEGRTHIAMPAAGLGAFGGPTELYFDNLMTVASEYPTLSVIYHPAQFGNKFDEALVRHQPQNVVRARKDITFIASELLKDGVACAYHNPSDCDVVYGVYDIGEYWKFGQGNGFVGEEYLGAMTTAPLNSRGLNPSAYQAIVERHLNPALRSAAVASVVEPEVVASAAAAASSPSDDITFSPTEPESLAFSATSSTATPFSEPTLPPAAVEIAESATTTATATATPGYVRPPLAAFETALEELRKKAESLVAASTLSKKANDIKASNEATFLYAALVGNYGSYRNQTISLDQFKQDCNDNVAVAHTVLDTHRGWKEFLTNLAIMVCTLGIAGAVNYKQTGHFFFKVKTDSEAKLDQLSEVVTAAM